MKVTHKRYLAAAFVAVSMFGLGVSQATQDPMGPTQPVQGSTVTTDNPSTTDLGVSSSGLAMTLDSSNRPNVVLNQTEVNFADAQPGFINGQLMVPIRDVAEQLGATVKWIDQDKEAVVVLPTQQTVTLDTNRDWLSLLTSGEQVNSVQSDNGGPAMHLMLSPNEVILIGNRAYMPFDQLANEINCAGNFDQSAGTATLTTTDGTNEEDVKSPDTAKTPPDETPKPDESGTPPDGAGYPDRT